MKIDRRKFIKLGGGLFGSYVFAINAPLTAEELKNVSKPTNIRKFTENKIAGISPFCDKAMTPKRLDCDVLVAGGGLAGICAAIAAAREGAKVVLVQDRSRLGGNASSEIKMHPLGMHHNNSGFREGGIIEEILLENLMSNPQKEWEVWDLLLYDKVVSEKNITLLLDTDLCGVETSKNEIKQAFARCDASRTFYEIKAKIYIDCTGDSRMAAEAGATLFDGRDAPETYGEEFSGYDPQGTHQGSSILFTSKDFGRPMPFKAPSWARKITAENIRHRGIDKNRLEYGFWWVELGGDMNAISDSEKLRFELLRVVLGAWDYVKNSGKFPEAENRAITSIGMLPGRRDTFRIKGEYIFKEQDILGNWKNLEDAIAVGGWSMDDHPKEGFDAVNRAPCRQIRKAHFYNIPFGSLISCDFKNLMMAGRNISCSHVAFTSTRVMLTSAACGNAAGVAAAMSAKLGKTPKEIRENKKLLGNLQQTLLRNNQAIVGVKNQDKKDLAKIAKVSANTAAKDTSAQNVISGSAFDLKGEYKNRYIAEISKKPVLTLSWDKPQAVSQIQITFDGGNRELTMTSHGSYLKSIIWGAQPEIIKDFKILGTLPNGKKEIIADVKDNYQRLFRLNFPAKKLASIDIELLATNGNSFARVNEVRIY